MNKKITKHTVHSFKGLLGDFATEWRSDADWIDHEAYVQKLKDTGEYLKPYSVDIILEDDPVYDSKLAKSKSHESHRIVILDMSKYEQDK